MKGIDAATTTRIEFMAFVLPTGNIADAAVNEGDDVEEPEVHFTRAPVE